jgi:hypothetical protein
MHALSSLPEHGIPNELKVIESVNEDVGSEDDIGEDSSIDYEEIVYNESTETSSVIPDIGNDQLECEAIRTALLNNKIDWPELEEKPLNEYTTPFLATMAFPTLFPDGKGDPTNPCLI